MHGFWAIVIAVGAILVTIAGVAGAAAAFVGYFNKERIDALRQDNTDLDARVARQHTEIERLKAERETDRVEIDGLKRDNARLEKLVTQRADVETVLQELRVHNVKAETWWGESSTHNQALENLMIEMVAAINKVATGLKP